MLRLKEENCCVAAVEIDRVLSSPYALWLRWRILVRNSELALLFDWCWVCHVQRKLSDIIGYFDCIECCSCRLVFLSHDLTFLFSFVALLLKCSFCRRCCFLPPPSSVLRSICFSLFFSFECVFLSIRWDWRWLCFLGSLFFRSGIFCFYVVSVVDLSSLCSWGTGKCLVRRAFCFWKHRLWKTCVFFCWWSCFWNRYICFSLDLHEVVAAAEAP